MKKSKKVARGTLQGNTMPVETNLEEASSKRETKLWAFTSYNETPPILTDDCKYIGFGKELCPETSREHWQSFVWFKKKCVKSTAIKRLKECHPFDGYKPVNLRACNGTFNDNKKYCSKDGQYTGLGEEPSPGARTDLGVIRDRIVGGESSDNIAMENPYMFHMYGRTMTKLEDLIARKKFRTEMTKGIWYYGSTGVGKSHKAFENYSPDTHYVLPNDGGWWDAYTQQETVIINDFRGEIKYNELLMMVDKWPYSVKRRNREPMPFTSKQIIITSSLSPDLIYRNRNKEDKMEQFTRRFEIVNMDSI